MAVQAVKYGDEDLSTRLTNNLPFRCKGGKGRMIKNSDWPALLHGRRLSEVAFLDSYDSGNDQATIIPSTELDWPNSSPRIQAGVFFVDQRRPSLSSTRIAKTAPTKRQSTLRWTRHRECRNWEGVLKLQDSWSP